MPEIVGSSATSGLKTNLHVSVEALGISDWKRPDYTSVCVCLFTGLRKVEIDPKIHLKDLKPHSHQPSLL